MLRTPFLTPLVLLLAAAPACSQAQAYRCTLPSGKLEYRDSPCTQGTQRVIDTTPAAGPAAPPAHVEPEHHGNGAPVPRGPDRYSFSHMTMSVRQALESLAPGPDGNLRVVVDPSIKAMGFFDYHDIQLPDLLADIARRYNLDIRNENGVITARPR